MKSYTREEMSAVSRRDFLAGGLMSLALAATHAEAASQIGGATPGTPSSILDVDLRRLVSRADLNYEAPATRSEEGVPVGNGTMGSLVWTTPEALHFQVNRCDVHAMGCSTDSFPCFSTDYSSGCAYVDIGFVDFGDDVFSGPSFNQHLGVYDAVVTARGGGISARILAWTEQDVFAVEIDDQREQPAPVNIDLRMLRYSMEYVMGRNYEMATHHEVVVRTNAHTATSRLNVQSGRISLTQAFEENEYYNGSAVVIGVTGRKAKAKYLNETTVRLSAAPGKGKFTVWIASASSYNRAEDVAATAGKKLDAAQQQGFTALLAANQEWWHSFWSKGFVHLHSTDGAADYVEENYTYFLYVMGASSRGSYPPRFGGMLWYTTGDMRMWGAEHWWNNAGAYYEGLAPANRLELLDPVFKMYSGKYDSYAEAASKQWGSKGVWLPETTWFDGLETLPGEVMDEMRELFLLRKPWDERSQLFERYARVKQMCNSRWNFENVYGKWELGAWVRGDYGKGPFGYVTHILSTTAKIAYVYWLRYDVSRDEAFLRETAYPMLKGTTEFYCNFPNLKKESDGKYHIYHVNNHEAFWNTQDTQEDLTAIRAIAPLAIAASKILGVDADLRPVWQEFLDNLAPLPTNDATGTRKDGEPQVWVADGAHGTGNVVDVPISFYDVCSIATEDPEMARIGNATYDLLNAKGVGENTVIRAMSRDSVAAAKMGRADHVRYLIPNQLKRLAPEHDDCDWVGSGKIGVLRNRLSLREGPGCMEYERGGLAAQALHTALLLDSPPAPGKAPIIHVFAAWPKEWDAEFTLVARGAFLVTSAIKEGNIGFVELMSQAGGECLLSNPWGDGQVVLFRNGSRAEDMSGRQLKFATAVNEVILVLKPGTAPAQFKRQVA